MTETSSSLQNPNEAQITLRFEEFASFVEQFSGKIALGGIFVETPKVRPVGTEVQLTCELGDGYQLLRGLGDVLWVRPKDDGSERPAGMGIRFNALDAKSRELVLKIVEENLKDGGEPFEIARVPPGASSDAPPSASDVSLDDLSEDPTLVGSVTAASTPAPSSPPRPAGGPGFDAPWGEKLPEIPVDIFGDESDPEVDEAVRSIRPDPSLVPPIDEGPTIDPNASAEFPVPEVAAAGRELTSDPDPDFEPALDSESASASASASADDVPFEPPEEDELTFEPEGLAFDPPEEEEPSFESEPEPIRESELETEPEAPLDDETEMESEPVSFDAESSAEIVFEPPADDLDEIDMEVDFGDEDAGADDASFGDVSFEDGPSFESEVKFEDDGFDDGLEDDFDGDVTAPGASTNEPDFEAAGEEVSFEDPSFESAAFEPDFEDEPSFEDEPGFEDEPSFEVASFDDEVDFDGDITAPSSGSTEDVAATDESAPMDDFASPDLDFAPPVDDFEAPPTDDFEAPAGDFGAPADDFSSPVDDFSSPATDFVAPVEDASAPPQVEGIGSSTGALVAEDPSTAHPDDFVDAWDGESSGASGSSFYGDGSGVAVASDARGRSLPVVPILAAVLVLAALGAAYFFRGEIASLVGLGGEPAPAATSAQRTPGPAPGAASTAPEAVEPQVDEAADSADGDAPADASAVDRFEEVSPTPSSTDTPSGDSTWTDSRTVGEDAPSVATAPGPGPEPAVVAAPRSARASGLASIVEVSSSSVSGGTRVDVRLDRPADQVGRTFQELAYDPVKQGLFLSGMANTYPRNRISMRTSEVSLLEIGVHPNDELRLIFTLARPGLPAAEVQTSGDTIVLFFRSR